jgi:hypothetical protein
MSEDGQKVEYVNALKESQDSDNLLASLSLQLKGIGEKLVGLGKALQGETGQHPLDWHARNFDRQSFEKEYAQIPDLLEQYKIAHAKRVELETHLGTLSWHKKHQ